MKSADCCLDQAEIFTCYSYTRLLLFYVSRTQRHCFSRFEIELKSYFLAVNDGLTQEVFEVQKQQTTFLKALNKRNAKV